MCSLTGCVVFIVNFIFSGMYMQGDQTALALVMSGMISGLFFIQSISNEFGYIILILIGGALGRVHSSQI